MYHSYFSPWMTIYTPMFLAYIFSVLVTSWSEVLAPRCKINITTIIIIIIIIIMKGCTDSDRAGTVETGLRYFTGAWAVYPGIICDKLQYRYASWQLALQSKRPYFYWKHYTEIGRPVAPPVHNLRSIIYYWSRPHLLYRPSFYAYSAGSLISCSPALTWP